MPELIKGPYHIISGVRISDLTRLNNSPDGNPRWMVLLSNGLELKTRPNADINYGIENSEYQNVALVVYVEKNEIADIKVRR